MVSRSGPGSDGVVDPPFLEGSALHYGHETSLPSNLTPLLPLTLAENTVPCLVDVRHLLIQQIFFSCQPRFTIPQPTATNPVLSPHFQSGLPAAFPPAGSMSWGLSQDLYHSMNISAASVLEPSLVDSSISSCQSGTLALPTLDTATSTNFGNVSVSPVKDNNCNMATTSPSTLEPNVSPAAPEDVSQFLLSFLEESDHPRFTAEQEEMERATMTDEERLAALSDQFGKKVEISSHRSKRARQDLDPKDIDFFVHQMRLEIERIPEDMKRALLEAQSKCRVDEFSDERLERFLRCAGMNTRVRTNFFESMSFLSFEINMADF
jgi:hypothetical protein